MHCCECGVEMGVKQYGSKIMSVCINSLTYIIPFLGAEENIAFLTHAYLQFAVFDVKSIALAGRIRSRTGFYHK